MKKYLNARGFILIDSLIAVVILSVAITALIGTFIMITKVRSSSDYRTVATRIIQAQFNDLQKSGYTKGSASWTQTSQSVQNIIAIAKNPANGPGNVNMVFNVSSALVDNTAQMPATGLQGVKITVSWNSTNGTEQVTETNYFFTQDADFSNGGLAYVSMQ